MENGIYFLEGWAKVAPGRYRWLWLYDGIGYLRTRAQPWA